MTRPKLIAGSVLATLLVLEAPAFAVNVLTDPGFESGVITTGLGGVLSNFPGDQNKWGPENAATTITGVTTFVSPAAGAFQLQVAPDSSTVSQVGQVVDISAYAAQIDANLVSLQAGALLNSDAPAAIASVSVSFFTGNTYGTLFGPLYINGLSPLDALTGSWEPVSTSGAVPANTRWLLFQIGYDSNSITGNIPGTNGTLIPVSGFADDAYVDLRIAPEPTTATLVAALAGFVGRRRR